MKPETDPVTDLVKILAENSRLRQIIRRAKNRLFEDMPAVDNIIGAVKILDEEKELIKPT